MIKYNSIGLHLEKFEEGRYTVATACGVPLGQVLGGGKTWAAEPRRGATRYFKMLEACAKWCLVECINDSVRNHRTKLLDVALLFKSRSIEFAVCDWVTGAPKTNDWTGFAKFGDRYWFIDWDSDGERQWTVIEDEEISPTNIENLKSLYANDPAFDLRAPSVQLPSLTPTAHGRIFDGILRNGWAGARYTGRIYGSSDHVEGGSFQSSTIVNVGFVAPFGFYIETRSRSRYLISFDSEDSSWQQWIQTTRNAIKSNPEYFEPLRWSDSAPVDA